MVLHGSNISYLSVTFVSFSILDVINLPASILYDYLVNLRLALLPSIGTIVLRNNHDLNCGMIVRSTIITTRLSYSSNVGTSATTIPGWVYSTNNYSVGSSLTIMKTWIEAKPHYLHMKSFLQMIHTLALLCLTRNPSHWSAPFSSPWFSFFSSPGSQAADKLRALHTTTSLAGHLTVKGL